jgi:hypothetical protein
LHLCTNEGAATGHRTPETSSGKPHPPCSKKTPTDSENGSKLLTENLTLQFKGEFQGLVELDVELTGLGPLFSAEIVVPSEEKETPATVISISSTITSLAPGDYKVDYSIGARVPVKTNVHQRPDGPSTVNFQFSDILLRGVAKVKEGKALIVSKINGKELQGILRKPGESNSQ